MSGQGEGGRGAKLSDCLNWQHIVSQKRKVMQKWRPETHNVQAFSYFIPILSVKDDEEEQ